MALGTRCDVQFRQLEVVVEYAVDVFAGVPVSPQPVAHLLMPPMVPGAVIAVRDGDQGCIGGGEHRSDSPPAWPRHMLDPHGCTVVLGALGVTHGLDVNGQSFGEAATNFLRGKVDEIGGRFRIGSDCSQPFLDYLSVGAVILNMSNECSMSAIR